jgi:scyllo-inositol 2-dehydrogenase (NADP+)
MSKLNVGLIGFGLSGRYLISPYLMANPHFNLKKIVQQRAATVSEIYPSVETVKSLDDVLSDKSIDLVIISSPHQTHFDYAQKCLLADKHVLIEKPMVATAEEGEILINLAKKQGRILSVYQNRRFDGDFKTIQKIMKNGFLGDIVNYEARYDRWQPILSPKKWKETPSFMSGILYDLGAHLIDQTLCLFGTPLSYSGRVMTQREHSEIDDAFDLRFDYGKLQVTLKASLLVREPLPRYVIHGTHGSYVKYGVDPQEDMLKAGMTPDMKGFGDENSTQHGTLNTTINGVHFYGKIATETGHYGALFQNLYETIVEGKDLNVKPEQVLEQIRIMEGIKKMNV